MSDYDENQKRIADQGGCKDWPCDYACLRRGTCDHLRNGKESHREQSIQSITIEG